MNITAGQALGEVTKALETVAREEAAQQARLLIAHALGCEPAALPAYRNETLSLMQQALLNDLVERRLQHEPVQYLLGEWGFMGLMFVTRPWALIPRQDTETLCEHALKLSKQHGYRTALDLCCGTGCIGISMAVLGGLAVTAADIDPDCVALTRQNAARNHGDITAIQSDWFEAVTGRFDLILSNPPYLSGEDMEALQPEVRYEPALALFGGQDGLQAYRRILQEYKQHLNPGGALLLEVGAGQAQEVCALFGGGCVIDDICGIPRVVCLELSE